MNDQCAKQAANPECADAYVNRVLGGTDYASVESGSTIRTQIEVRADNPFEAALYALKQGHRVTRRGWNAGGQWVAMQRPDKHSKMSLPYLYIKTAQADQVPWHASQSDILAHDWAILPIQPI